MADIQDSKDSLSENLQQVLSLLEKHKLVEGLVHNQNMHKHELVEALVHKQHLSELQAKLDALHPADVADILDFVNTDGFHKGLGRGNIISLV